LDLRRDIRDRRLVHAFARSRSGDERAFRALYRSLYEPVAGYVARRIHDADDAEDVIARIFHRLLDRLDHYDPARGSVWTWTMTLARNAVIDHWRSHREQERLEDLDDVLCATGPDPLEDLIGREEERLAHGVLRRESAETREIFALYFADGLRYREIAALVGLSEAAVKQRFSRTMRRLRQRESDPRKTEGDGHGHVELAPTRCAEDGARS